MRKALLITAGFLVSALIGPILLVLIAFVGYWMWSHVQPPTHSGIGAVAGGISEATVTTVAALPILFGTIGALITAQRIAIRRP